MWHKVSPNHENSLHMDAYTNRLNDCPNYFIFVQQETRYSNFGPLECLLVSLKLVNLSQIFDVEFRSQNIVYKILRDIFIYSIYGI